MTPREREVLALVTADPLISQADIAAKLGITRSAVAGHIMNLTAKGVIRGRGYVIAHQPFVVAVGGANIDICGAPQARLRRRDSNPGAVRTSPGGVARNVAENLARLGVDARLVSAVGRDSHGDLLLDQGRAAGIDMSHVQKLDGERTSTYVSILDEEGDMLMAINDMSIVDRIDVARLQEVSDLLKQASIVVCDTNLGEDALKWLVATSEPGSLVADTVSVAKAKRLRDCLHGIDLLKAGAEEASAICGSRCRTRRELDRAARWFHGEGVREVVITLGARGAYFSDGFSAGIEPAVAGQGDIANATGAGDALLAGLVWGRLQGLPFADAVRAAQLAAGSTAAHPDTINPSIAEAMLAGASGAAHA